MVAMQSSHQFNKAASTDYEVRVVQCPRDMGHWHLVNDYLKLRKAVFVDRMSWPLFHAENLEFEQYDTFDTVYVVATLNDEVVGGARLRRTDQITGTGQVQYTYMIRDACLGILPGLPRGLCYETPPLDNQVWELTRLVVNGPHDVSPMIFNKMNDFLRSVGAESVLFLGSPAFQRMANSLGWTVRQLGPVSSNSDGTFQVFECPVRELT